MMNDFVIEKGQYHFYEYEICTYPDDKYYYYRILDRNGSQHYWLGCPIIKDCDEGVDSLLEAIEKAKEQINIFEDGSEPDYDYHPPSIDWDERRRLGE